MEIKHISLELKDIGKEGIITGYFASFGNLDYTGDIIKQGAFSKTIQERGAKIKYFLDHRQPIGSVLTLREDAKGLYYEGQLSSVSIGSMGRITKDDLISMITDGLITEHSIGYETIKAHYQDPSGAEVGIERRWDAGIIRVLDEVKLYEGSLITTFAANDQTPITGIKSMFERALHNGSYTDDTMKLIEIQLTKINDLLANPDRKPDKADGTEKPPPPDATIDTVSDDMVKYIFINSLKNKK